MYLEASKYLQSDNIWITLKSILGNSYKRELMSVLKRVLPLLHLISRFV